MSDLKQLDLFEKPELAVPLRAMLIDLLDSRQQPSATELVQMVEQKVGLEARWELIQVVQELADCDELTHANRDYFKSLLRGKSLDQALRGAEAPDHEAISSIDFLLGQSRRYRDSQSFQELIDFVGRFRDYAPYNNMLVRIQNPSCGFFATAKDWRVRFKRALKEDARPMLILAPMHPVMLVYDIDQTEGDELPEELKKFSRFEGVWDPRLLTRMIENAKSYRIRVDMKTLSSTNGGFATVARESGDSKMRVAIHDGLDEPSRFGVLCHELAHILLGHLGSDFDHWWPARTNLSHAAVEVEAESVAWVVTSRFGLAGSSAAYVSRHLKDGQTPTGVSPDMIAKTSGLIERMARDSIPAKKPRKRKEQKS